MKRQMFSLVAVGLLLACSVVVYAGAQKIDLVGTDALATAEGGIHANANGFVVINMTPKGATDVTIQIQLRDAAGEYEYVVKSAGVVLGTLTTNKKGSGGLHINLTADDPALGAAVNIWTSDGSIRLLRAIL